MKRVFIKIFDKIIVLLLGFSGVFSACDDPVCEYGMPHADYVIKGTVTDKETSNPIQNIRVIRQHPEYLEYGDTLYTDSEGKYAFEFGNFPPWSESTFHLKIEDIDGKENGGYFGSKEIDVAITEADRVKKGDGRWYSGKFAKTQNIELNRIDTECPMYGVLQADFKP